MTPLTPEPRPLPGHGDVWLEVYRDARQVLPRCASVRTLLDDMLVRRQQGIDRYHTPLQRGNGRRHYADAYQEAMDLVVYLWAADAPRWLRWAAVALAWAIAGRAR